MLAPCCIPSKSPVSATTVVHLFNCSRLDVILIGKPPACRAATKMFSSLLPTRRGLASFAAPSEDNFITRLIKMRVVKNQTTNGKVSHFSALVVAGNGRGGLGFAQAKHASGPDAIQKAARKATRGMEFYERWQDRTLFHDDYVKFKATKLYVRPAAPSTHPGRNALCRNGSAVSSCNCRDLQMHGN